MHSYCKWYSTHQHQRTWTNLPPLPESKNKFHVDRCFVCFLQLNVFFLNVRLLGSTTSFLLLNLTPFLHSTHWIITIAWERLLFCTFFLYSTSHKLRDETHQHTTENKTKQFNYRFSINQLNISISHSKKIDWCFSIILQTLYSYCWTQVHGKFAFLIFKIFQTVFLMWNENTILPTNMHIGAEFCMHMDNSMMSAFCHLTSNQTRFFSFLKR